jgi:hypothetical protein
MDRFDMNGLSRCVLLVGSFVTDGFHERTVKKKAEIQGLSAAPRDEAARLRSK